MTELLELPDEIELSDAELSELENISGGCAASGVSLGGLHFGFGGLHLGGGFHHGGGFSFGGFYGGPVVVQAVPVQQVALVPVQSTAVVAEPVAQTVAATSCSQGVTLATC